MLFLQSVTRNKKLQPKQKKVECRTAKLKIEFLRTQFVNQKSGDDTTLGCIRSVPSASWFIQKWPSKNEEPFFPKR